MTRARGTGSIYQRGPVFWIRYSHRGRKFRESSKSERRGDAVRLLRQRLGEIGAGRLVGPQPDRTTIDDLAALVLTSYDNNALRSADRVRAAFGHLGAFFALDRVPDITSARVGEYIRRRRGEDAAAATVNYELACLRRAFNLAVDAGLAAQCPRIKALELDNARKGFFEVADFEAVVAALPAPLQPLMRFLYLTGWRAGEALALTWANVDLAAGVVRLEPGTTKNRKGRTFPFSALPPLAALLQEQRERTAAIERAEGRIIQPVFHRNGKPIVSYVRAWLAACKATGLEGRLVHDFRRTAVRNLERAGVSRSVAMQLTGHRTTAVYDRYAITSEADLSEGVTKLATLHGATGSRTVLPFVPKGTVRAQSAG